MSLPVYDKASMQISKPSTKLLPLRSVRIEYQKWHLATLNNSILD
jgi:hypothetical protein